MGFYRPDSSLASRSRPNKAHPFWFPSHAQLTMAAETMPWTCLFPVYRLQTLTARSKYVKHIKYWLDMHYMYHCGIFMDVITEDCSKMPPWVNGYIDMIPVKSLISQYKASTQVVFCIIHARHYLQFLLTIINTGSSGMEIKHSFYPFLVNDMTRKDWMIWHEKTNTILDLFDDRR